MCTDLSDLSIFVDLWPLQTSMQLLLAVIKLGVRGTEYLYSVHLVLKFVKGLEQLLSAG